MAKIKIAKDLYKRALEHTQQLGYSSVDEFVAHCIEKVLYESQQGDDDGDEDDAKVTDRLRGLGYID